MSVQIPEPFLGALKQVRPQDVSDAAAASPEALFGRALARMQVGRDREARVDLEAAKPFLVDASSIELAYLDLRAKLSYEEALATSDGVVSRSPERNALRARALHVLGLARGKLHRFAVAVDALLESSTIYRELGDRAGLAQVQDTLGTVHAASGRPDLALSAYAMSLVEKTLEGDLYGMAITLGNLGRVHLQAGRFHDAVDCFEADYRIAARIGDRRGCARMLNDLGRARLGLESYDLAQRDLEACLEIACADGFKDMELFARKDLAMVFMAQERFAAASGELDLAEVAATAATGPYLHALVEAARGELFLAQNDPRALGLLEHAAQLFADAGLPDHEIPLRITLARAYMQNKLGRMAEVCLEVATERARRDGYDRYRRPLREAMARLGWVGRVAEEQGRLSCVESEKPADPEGYTLLEKLGEGAFGEVFRAYDPVHDQVVALKRIRLGKVYDVSKRRELVSSARRELEAASQLRHPGLARVFAIGYDDAGDIYVTQEFVKGRSLAQLMASQPRPEALLVLRKTQLLANALQAMHKLNIVHRDLKPENILLRAPDDSPVLVDFGIAYVPEVEGLDDRVGIGGTFPFIAPELFQHAPASHKSDMFSLGVVLYLWLAGRLPWDLEGKDWAAAVEEKSRRDVPPLASLRPDLPPELAELVGRLMHSVPDRRPGPEELGGVCQSLIEGELVWDNFKTGPIPPSASTPVKDTTFILPP